MMANHGGRRWVKAFSETPGRSAARWMRQAVRPLIMRTGPRGPGNSALWGIPEPRQSGAAAGNSRPAVFAWVQAFWYLSPISLIALTLPADGPSGSNDLVRKASAMSLASSAPTTRAPMVMIWALFEVAALPAE